MKHLLLCFALAILLFIGIIAVGLGIGLTLTYIASVIGIGGIMAIAAICFIWTVLYHIVPKD